MNLLGLSRATKPGTCLRLSLAPSLSELSKARDLVDEIASRVDISPERVFDIKVALGEACANSVEHAHSRTEIAAWLLRDRLLIEVTSRGPFLSGLHKDTNARRRGLGLPLMAALSDQMHISQLTSELTRVSLTFFLAAALAEEPKSAPDQLISLLSAKRQMLDVAAAQAQVHMSQIAEIVDRVSGAPTPKMAAEALLDWALRLTGCEGGMVRLRDIDADGEQWLPAVVHSGLGDGFLREEALIRTGECMCGRVCLELTDAKIPYFTELGSFAWGRAQSLVEEFGAETIGEVRGRCIQEGYESVAIFPLPSVIGVPLGVLHLVDSRVEAFDDMHRTLEWGCRMCGSLLDRSGEHALLVAGTVESLRNAPAD